VQGYQRREVPRKIRSAGLDQDITGEKHGLAFDLLRL